MNKDILTTFFSGIKISLPLLVVIFGIAVLGFDLKGLTGAFVASRIVADNNVLGTTDWTPEVPVNLGYNMDNEDDYATPRPDTDVECGGVTSINHVSHHWTDVSAGDPLVKYQRQYDLPWTISGSWTGNEIYSDPYSNYRVFSTAAGVEGTYNSRVRAFYDANDNNVLDDGEAFSDWSDNDCQITFDREEPEVAWINPTDGQYVKDGIELTATCDGGVTDSTYVNFWWYKASEGQTVDEARDNNQYHYVYRYDATTGAVVDNTFSWNLDITDDSLIASGLDWEGEWKFRAACKDEAGNYSHAEINTTIDTQKPTATIQTLDDQSVALENRVVNGGFEDGLSNWVASGDVSVVTTDALGNGAYQGDKMAMIGKVSDPGNDVTVNVLSQDINNSDGETQTVGFWYNFMSYEAGLGYDDPGFMVFVNDTMIHQVWASQMVTDNDAHTLDSTGWKFISVDVSGMDQATLSLAFYSGNTGDSNIQSFVYIDQVSTSESIVNGGTEFKVVASDENPDPVAHYRYVSGGTTYEGNDIDEAVFSLVGQPDDDQIEYWSVDQAGNESDHHYLHVVFDNEAPSIITDLEAVDEADGEYTLTLTAPGDNISNPVAEYLVRYSTAPITGSTDWSSLLIPARLDDGVVPGTFDGPQPAGTEDEIVLTGLTAGQEYYFVVRSKDGAGNISDLSNIAVVNKFESPVVMNEIMYDPTSDENGLMPDGEWVELYNNSDTDVDVADWEIRDDDGNVIVISTANSDNNLDLADSGETVVPAHDRLVVYRNGSEMLNNDGDVVSLFTDLDQLVDTHTYAGGKPEGNTEARLPEGTGDWQDPIATPGTPNAATVDDLQPQVKLWQETVDTAKMSLFDSQNYEVASYLITYDHTYEEATVTDSIEGSVDIFDQSRLHKSDLYFGTCSTECTPHQGINNVSVQVTLTKEGTEDNIITYEYPEDWRAE